MANVVKLISCICMLMFVNVCEFAVIGLECLS